MIFMKKSLLVFLAIAMALCLLVPVMPSQAQAATESALPDSVERIYGSNRCATALKVAAAAKDELGVSQFDVILYASASNSADALAGSFLSAVKSAPILLYHSSESIVKENMAFIQENLRPGGTVYILGGIATIPETVDNALTEAGFIVSRASGRNRFLTNLEILKKAGFTGGKVLVCTSDPFADSLSASATGEAILLVDKTWTELSSQYLEYLADFTGKCDFYVIGGNASVTEKLQESLMALDMDGEVKRVSGSGRFATSVEVAKEFFDVPTSAVLAYAQEFPDGLCGGALAYAKNAPLILTQTNKTDAAKAYVQGEGIKTGAVLGGAGLISDEATKDVFLSYNEDYSGTGSRD